MNRKPGGKTRLLAGLLRSSWFWLLVALAVGSILSVMNGLSNGWDLINYHIYNPWALLHHRDGMDLLPASVQGYFDPLLDIPYYLVAYVWWPGHPWVVAALTGLPFGLLAFLALLLARRVLAGLLTRQSEITRTLTILAVVIVAMSGVSTWSQAFTTTNEILVSIPVLAAVILLVERFVGGSSARQMSPARALSIGVLLGVAAGFKLTAIVYAPAGGLLLFAACRGWKSMLRNGAVFFAGWVVAFVILYGPWAMHLYTSTGNPFFPLFNHQFQSQLASGDVPRDARFLPQSASEWLFAPFYWLDDHTWTVFPLQFRDVRFALILILGLAVAVIALIVRLRGAENIRTTPLPLLAVLGFWFIAYAVWLPLFSMLRYAIVLEVAGSILAAGAVLYLATLFFPRLPGIARTVLVLALAAGVMGFAHIPSYDRIPLQAPVFAAKVPRLGPHPLVILANQPMGLLAPLIQRTNHDATFIGIASCFTRDDWCYNAFYQHGLGSRMRDRIAKHEGTIYVAYYADRMPTLTQLDLFHVVVDTIGHCQVMHTNRTANVKLCPAHYQPGPLAHPRGAMRFRYAVRTRILDPSFKVDSRWLSNACGNSAALGQLAFEWQASPGTNNVQIFVEAPPSADRSLFASGAVAGNAKTGSWVKSGQDFVFTDGSGRLLARSSIGYARCDER
jgi:hypothetical protein